MGGGETILLSLLTSLNKKQFKSHVVLTKKGSFSKSLKKLKVPTSVISMNGYLAQTFFLPGMSIRGLRDLYALTKKLEPSIIHVNNLNLVVYAGIVGKLLNIPVVATAHGPWDSYYLFQDLATSIFADMVLANTPGVQRSLLKKGVIPRKKVKTLHFGIDTKIFSPAKNKDAAKKAVGYKPTDIVITWVGRFDPIKDPLTFLRAAKIVYKKYPNAAFLVIGSDIGDFSKDQDKNVSHSIKEYLSSNTNLTKRVTLKGFVNYEKISNAYRTTDIFVSSSHSESFGLAIAEAQSTGIPVVVTNSGGQKLIVKEGITGYLVEPKNPKKLASSIIKLIKSEEKRYGFGKKGRNYILKNFNINTYTKNVENIYSKLATNK